MPKLPAPLLIFLLRHLALAEQRPKVGLVLSGGGARGLQIGKP